MQPSATSPLFVDNLHFEHFDNHFKVDLRLTLLSKCSKWRLSTKRGLVADGCINEHSLMRVPSLSRGCEMAPFFVRHTARHYHGAGRV